MKTYYKDASLTITEDYIRYDGDVMPTWALSFFSLTKLEIKWWVPIVLILLGVIGIWFFKDINVVFYVSFLLLGYGIYKLIDDIIESRRRFCYIYSHSGHCISFETTDINDMTPITTALFQVIIPDDEDDEDADDSDNM